MSFDKKIKRFIGISAAILGIAFIGMNILAKKKKPSSVYEDDRDQKNPFEGKKVVLVEDENDQENADGVKGHLEAIGDSEYTPSFYAKHVKRAIDVVLSFGGPSGFITCFRSHCSCYKNRRSRSGVIHTEEGGSEQEIF